MISSKKFQTIFNSIKVNGCWLGDKFKLEISEPNEENIIEFAVIDKGTKEALFTTYDNRIYINANFDLDVELLGYFESIDGCENYITFQYDTKDVFIKDIIKILYFNISILV
tara:strand:+ start:121 stop:456 length:336 start_codon:yes stop_codon:yes gene_type:complete